MWKNIDMPLEKDNSYKQRVFGSSSDLEPIDKEKIDPKELCDKPGCTCADGIDKKP